jgi:hypothetical protein
MLIIEKHCSEAASKYLPGFNLLLAHRETAKHHTKLHNI